jgi:hypothetical protein
MRPDPLPSPWAKFFDAVDQALSGPVVLHCLGGFVVSIWYGRERQTVDLDVVTIAPIPWHRRDPDNRGQGIGSCP